MTAAAFFHDHKRTFALALAAGLLHWMAIAWFGGRLGGMAAVEDAAPVIVAQLRAAPPEPPAVVPPPPKAATPPAANRVPRYRPPANSLPQVQDDPGLLIAPRLLEPVYLKPPQMAPEDAALAAAAAAGAAAGATAETPAAAPPPAYKIDLPPSAELELQVVRSELNANPSYGVGRIVWQADGDRYRMRVEAGLDLLFTTLTLLDIQSEGALGAAGIEPVKMTETRRGRSQTATHFGRQNRAITFSASAKSAPLTPGAQDKISLMMQLAGIGRADAGQLNDNHGFEMQVGEDKDATVFTFYALGFDEVVTKLGTLRAWHVSRPPRPGTYSSGLDIWFAPELGWYPVQIRNTEANGAITTQTVTKILTAPAVRKKTP